MADSIVSINAHEVMPGSAVSDAKSSSKLIKRLAVLVSAERYAALNNVTRDLINLAEMTSSEILGARGPKIVLIEAGIEGFEQIILSLAVEQQQTAVILMGDQLPGHIVRALMTLETSDLLPSSASLEDIAASVNKIGESLKSKGSDTTAACWAFKGAVGGAGVTTIALESAFELARRVGPDKVCVVDLNVADGMTYSFLEGAAKLDLAALSEAPERLDQRLLAAWCWQHADGVSLIAAPRDADADLMATEAAILRLLDVACGSFEYVLLDMPRHRMPWSASVMAAVDHVVVVSELTVPSLHAAADLCREIDVVRAGSEDTKLVLNRMFPRKRFRAEFAVEQAEKAIQHDIALTIASDWDAARTAVNLGQPIAAVKAKSAIVGDIARLVNTLVPEGADIEIAQTGRKRKRG